MIVGFYRTTEDGKDVSLLGFIIENYLVGGDVTAAERIFPSLPISLRKFPQRHKKHTTIKRAAKQHHNDEFNKCFKEVALLNVFDIEFVRQYIGCVAKLRPDPPNHGQAKLREQITHKRLDE